MTDRRAKDRVFPLLALKGRRGAEAHGRMLDRFPVLDLEPDVGPQIIVVDIQVVDVSVPEVDRARLVAGEGHAFPEAHCADAVLPVFPRHAGLQLAQDENGKA
jgi:hypothetical protein